MTPDLTIGMACYDDYPGVWMTVQHLRMNHRDALPRCELVVVDNHPGSPHGEAARNFLGWVKGDFARVRYLSFPSPVGTAAPRQHVFDVAEGKAVLCMDSHVLPVPGSIERLLDYYDHHPCTRDLLSGPLLYDDLATYASHFDNVWRGEMWGVWGNDPRASDPDGEPFEVWGQGLGLFSCRREAWLGFSPRFRGFGGEEGYIHTKFRQAGARCLCLPWLRWAHRFGWPGGVPYACTREQRIHNYIVGHRDLGLSLDRIRDHFVGEGHVTDYSFSHYAALVDAGMDFGLRSNPLPDNHPSYGGIVRFATTFGQGYQSDSVTRAEDDR